LEETDSAKKIDPKRLYVLNLPFNTSDEEVLSFKF